jgi:hypothetical protein
VRFGGGGRLDIYWQDVRLVVDDPDRFKKHRPFLGPVLADARERGLGVEYVDLRFQDVVAKYRTLGAREDLSRPVNYSRPPPPLEASPPPRIGPETDLESFFQRTSNSYESPLLDGSTTSGAQQSSPDGEDFGILPGPDHDDMP